MWKKVLLPLVFKTKHTVKVIFEQKAEMVSWEIPIPIKHNRMFMHPIRMLLCTWQSSELSRFVYDGWWTLHWEHCDHNRLRTCHSCGDMDISIKSQRLTNYDGITVLHGIWCYYLSADNSRLGFTETLFLIYFDGSVYLSDEYISGIETDSASQHPERNRHEEWVHEI